MRRKRSLWQGFGLLIVVIGLMGIGLALFADRPSIGDSDGYWGALREIGGAVVAGAILAGLVVWFEDRREGERIEREEEREQNRFEREQAREDQAAKSAWQREIDIKLVALVTVDLAEARDDRIAGYERGTRSRSLNEVVSRMHESPRSGKSFADAFSELDSLLRFRRDVGLSSAWHSWNKAHQLLATVAPPRRERQKATSAFSMPTDSPPSRDPNAHAAALERETKAWDRLLNSIEAHIELNYPL